MLCAGLSVAAPKFSNLSCQSCDPKGRIWLILDGRSAKTDNFSRDMVFINECSNACCPPHRALHGKNHAHMHSQLALARFLRLASASA